MQEKDVKQQAKVNVVESLILALFLLLAAFLRFHQIDSIPPAMQGDEARTELEAQEILAGHFKIYFKQPNSGQEPFFHYLIALCALVFGFDPILSRLITAGLGVATVGLAYFLVKEMFLEEGVWRARWLAVITVLGLTSSFWVLVLNRLALRGNILPFLEVLSFYFLWRGLHTERQRFFILSGITLALSLYTYVSARFIPIMFVFFFLGQWVCKEDGQQPLWKVHFRSLALLVVVAFLIFIPLAVYFVFNQEYFYNRAAMTSAFAPYISKGDPWGTLWRSFEIHIGMLFLYGDDDWLYNIPGKPILPPVLAFCFIVGMVLSLARLRRPPYLFALFWWWILLLPSIISPGLHPSSGRAVGIVPVIYLFPAIALVEFLEIIKPRVKLRAEALFGIGVAALFAFTLYNTYVDYFHRWSKEEAVNHAYEVYARRLAEEMEKESNPRAVFIIPLNLVAQKNHPLATLELYYKGQAAHAWVLDDEAVIPSALTEACFGKNTVHLVNWKASKHRGADPKGYITFLLEKHGWLAGEKKLEYFDIITYRLASTEVDFASEPDWWMAKTDFGGRLILDAYAYGLSYENLETSSLYAFSPPMNLVRIPSGGQIWVLLRWETSGVMGEDYKVSVRLLDKERHILAQVDRILLGPWHQPTSGWSEGQKVVEGYILSIPPGTPPGQYRLGVMVYSEKTLTPLVMAEGNIMMELGPIQVTRPTRQLPLAIPDTLPLEIGEGISVLSYEGPDTARPGDKITLALYWQARQKINENYSAVFRIQSKRGEILAEKEFLPLGCEYPTSFWQPGEIWRGLYDFLLPAEISAGEHILTLALEGKPEKELARLKIEGRARLFTIPPISHPLKANWGGLMELLGYDLEPGPPLRLTFYWRALAEMHISYTFFVHLLDEKGRVCAQQDNIPGKGTLPTTSWMPGEVIIDEYEIDTPPESYIVEIGWYEAETGRRVKLTSGEENRLLIHRYRPERD